MVSHWREASASDLPAAETIIRKMEGVLQVQVYGDRLHVFAVDALEVRPRIEAALRAGGLVNIEIRTAVPRLEEAFISLVTNQG